MSPPDRYPYYSFLLRLWAEPGDNSPIWRASLEDTRTGKRQGFPSVEALIAYLREQTSLPLVPPARDSKGS